MIVKGKNLIVKIADTVIACARSCELSIEAETIEVSNPKSGIWRRYIAGRKSWSVSISSLVAINTGVDEPENMRQALNMVGTEALLTFQMVNASGKWCEFCGVALCKGSKITGTNRQLAQGAWDFIGNGELCENDAREIICKGILSYQTGGAETGYYLTYSEYNSNKIDKLILNDCSGDHLVQYDLTPNTKTRYIVGTTTYVWNSAMNKFMIRLTPAE